MSRSASMQFTVLSPAEAAAYLARQEKTADSLGDRIAARRRLQPVTTAEERARARTYNERAAVERLQKILRGEWPASYKDGPIIVRATQPAEPADA